MNLRSLPLLALVLFAGSCSAYAQCCSPGNPVAGSSNVGIVDQGNIRAIAFFRHSYSDTYFDGKTKAEIQGTIANYEYVGTLISYGLLKKLTIDLEAGYFLKKRQETDYFTHETHGFTNGVLNVKYAALKTFSNWEITVGAGYKFPFNTKTFVDEWDTPLPPDIQPSTRARGFVGQTFISKNIPSFSFKAVWLNRYEINGRSKDDYRFGNSLISTLFLSKKISNHFTGLLGTRYEKRELDYEGDIKFSNSGGTIVLVSPQISYSFPPYWNIALLSDFPVYRKYNGLQLGVSYAIALSIMKEFGN